MNRLARERCSPQHAHTRLEAEEIPSLLEALSESWRLDGDALVRRFDFANYHETMAFVNACAWISHREDHHPDLSVHYNRVEVSYSTHDAGGLTRNDFICAAKLDVLDSL